MSVAYGHLRDTLRQITPSPVFLSVAGLPSADTLRPATVDMHRRDRPHSPLVRDTPLFNRVGFSLGFLTEPNKPYSVIGVTGPI
jgi:hypothetical protein